jgi:putative endonuclease
MRGADARRRAERLGRSAEARALLALLLKGYLPVARRAKTPLGEIDLLVRRGRLLAVVEVKARASLGEGLEAVGAKSRARIARAVDWWLARRPRYAGLDLRYDLVVVQPRRWPVHVPDAFRPEL